MRPLLLLLLLLALPACPVEKPGVEVLLVVQEGEELDTTELKSLLVLFGPDDPDPKDFTAVREQQQQQELLEAPPGEVDVIVYACNGPAACSSDLAVADFVGCTRANLVATDDVVIVTVDLFGVSGPPASCDGLL